MLDALAPANLYRLTFSLPGIPHTFSIPGCPELFALPDFNAPGLFNPHKGYPWCLIAMTCSYFCMKELFIFRVSTLITPTLWIWHDSVRKIKSFFFYFPTEFCTYHFNIVFLFSLLTQTINFIRVPGGLPEPICNLKFKFELLGKVDTCFSSTSIYSPKQSTFLWGCSINNLNRQS